MYVNAPEAGAPGLLGLDVGSTTVKLVLLASADGEPQLLRYRRHRGDPIAAVRQLLAELPAPGGAVRPFVTGSNAGPVGHRWGLASVHEVSSVGAAVRAWNPGARSAVEIGGQDAKLLLWGTDGAVQVAMNDRCAAGTGVTIDRCLSRLGVDWASAASVAFEPARLHRVSTKCGVFAETDLINLARRGVEVPELVASLADALVVQCLALLTMGARVEPPLVLLGGPHYYLPVLVAAWRHRLAALWCERGDAAAGVALDELVTVPEQARYYAALGACVLGAARAPDGESVTVAQLEAQLSEATVSVPVVLDEPFRAAGWRQGHRGYGAATASAGSSLYLGVDAGSTMTKAVLIDDAGGVVAKVSRPSREPVADARGAIADLEHAVRASGRSYCVQRVGVTGYGGAVLAPVVGAAVDAVETVAHVRAARAVDPCVEVVCDVGGQDIKVIALDGSGAVRDFWLSSQCSAGIGAALHATADELGVEPSQYADLAISAARVPRFGQDCAVFMDTKRISYQRDGFAPAEILAGMARAVPRIVWSQVTNAGSPAELGRRFVLQGGTHCNAAVVQAQLEYLAERVPGAVVAVHPEPGLAGAVGAALLARDRCGEACSSEGLLRLTESSLRVRSDADTACSGCDSRCPRTFVEVRQPARAPAVFVSGHSCDRGAEPAASRTARPRRTEVPNLIAVENRLTFARHGGPRLHRPLHPVRVGIPRALAMYRCAPLLRAYLESLGAQVVFSPATSDRMWLEGARYGANDPCFPTKVVLAHVHHLLTRVHDRGRVLDAVVVAHVTHAVTPVLHVADSASCVVVTASPALVRSAFGAAGGELARRGIRLLDPVITSTRPQLLCDQLYEAFEPLLRMSRAASDQAVAHGLATARTVSERLVASGQAVLEAIEAGRWPSAVVLLARPYHADPGLNHRIGEELQAVGLPVIPISCLPREPRQLERLFSEELASGTISDPFDVRDLLPGCANSGAAERVWAARFAARHDKLAVVDLSSFRCGQDAPTYAPIKQLLEGAGVVTCALHELDETRPVTSLRVRLRTFLHALAERGLAP